MANDPQDVVDRECLFKRFDANGDGKISTTELGNALQTLDCVTPEEIKHMMAEIDTDGDGYISYKEFMDFALAKGVVPRYSRQVVLSQSFSLLDLKSEKLVY